MHTIELTTTDRALYWAVLPRQRRVHTRPGERSLTAYVNGNPFLVLTHDRLAVRVDMTHAERLRAAGGRPLATLAGPTPFVALPSAWSTTPVKARLWARRALDIAATLPARVPPEITAGEGQAASRH